MKFFLKMEKKSEDEIYYCVIFTFVCSELVKFSASIKSAFPNPFKLVLLEFLMSCSRAPKLR